MKKAKNGDTVKLEYKARRENGEIVDTSIDRKPLEFTVGEGKVSKIIEESVVGMEPGSEKTVTLTPENAYGKYREDLVFTVDRSKLPLYIKPKPGMSLQIKDTERKTFPVTVTDVTESKLTLNANHPYAGEKLHCEIKLLEIA
ncbi:peptidylprolyl isomerase [Fibrobacterota bacterium]